MRQVGYIQAITEALREEMQRDESVFIIGEDVQGGAFGTTSGLVGEFGTDRVMDTPLAETAVAGTALGSAMAGYRPVVDFMFADFMWCCADEVFLKAAKWHFIHGGKVNLPMVLMSKIGGYGRLGPEHSQSPAGVVLHTPGLKLAMPSDAYSAKGLMKTAIRDNNPVVFFFHMRLLAAVGPIPDEEYTLPFGVADIKREGSDVTVVATSYMVDLALQAATALEDRISVEVIDPRTLEPLDIDTIIRSVEKTGRAVIVDEDVRRGGVGAEIGMQIMERAFDSLDSPVQRVGAADLPIAAGYMEQYVLPQTKDVVAAIESAVV